MKKYFALIAFATSILFVFVLNFTLVQPLNAQSPEELKHKAKITVLNEQEVVVRVLEGKYKEREFKVLQFDRNQKEILGIDLNDTVFVSINENNKTAFILDHFRLWPLILLTMIFIAFVVVIGRRKGFLSLLAMIISFFIIIKAVIPQILLGNNPILISLLASFFIIQFNFYFSHGISQKTTIAVLSTFITLIITGVLSLIFVSLTKLTGFASEEATFLSLQVGQAVDIKALLLSGIIIGAMGVLDDITISQASIVWKLKKANPKYSRWELFKESMDLGRDHIASLVNTLVLVYAGASLPLFVLFSSSQFGNFIQVVNMEIIATEIVRTLVSSIGIILAVPITSYLSTYKR